MIRILTTIFDGKPQPAGARYYQIPLTKFMKKTPAAGSSKATSSIASQPESKVTK